MHSVLLAVACSALLLPGVAQTRAAALSPEGSSLYGSHHDCPSTAPRHHTLPHRLQKRAARNLAGIPGQDYGSRDVLHHFTKLLHANYQLWGRVKNYFSSFISHIGKIVPKLINLVRS
ncbi:uncharacterized protein LOC134535274 isoform X2 [Bacillus rossius redtenbacheri]|uniref:uncharacterized protein LOC134535274 isoform X2 n=1 Tax=Bacillus rossius redtenbacheri TaxID=93214 RepID=UPI002FDDBAE8